jgi:type IV secretory pathway protease TraF
MILKVVHLQRNLSASMPLGFYQDFKTLLIKQGDMVFACLADNVANEGLQRDY